MTLVIFHHHFRPGGVRRVIELATPNLLRHAPRRFDRVLLATGEAPDAAWLETFTGRLAGTRIEVMVNPAFSYAAELSMPVARQPTAIKAGLITLLQAGGDDAIVWAHNIGLGRNLRLARQLARLCELGGIPLIVHHHDWWFDNRWPQYPALRRSGGATLDAIAQSVLAASPWIAHAAINETEAATLARHLPGRAGWLPNPVEPYSRVPDGRAALARTWLREQLGEDAPVWLVPCRLLRRKNLAEALLLTRWLRPEAWLVTTAGVSSPGEAAYAARLREAVRARGWRLRLAMLEGGEHNKPTVPELLAASEAVLLTSIQEGFGLPYLEAAAAGRPLIARRLPNIAPDLATFGFTFPQSYAETLIEPALFDWVGERERQRRLFAGWRQQMPSSVRRQAPRPSILAANARPEPVAFSRLTLTAQLEVLAHPAPASWARCAPLNPWLEAWRQRVAIGTLEVSQWPAQADRWLGGPAYARRFFALVPTVTADSPPPGAPSAAQAALLADKLTPESLYPLLWHSET